MPLNRIEKVIPATAPMITPLVFGPFRHDAQNEKRWNGSCNHVGESPQFFKGCLALLLQLPEGKSQHDSAENKGQCLGYENQLPFRGPRQEISTHKVVDRHAPHGVNRRVQAGHQGGKDTRHDQASEQMRKLCGDKGGQHLVRMRNRRLQFRVLGVKSDESPSSRH